MSKKHLVLGGHGFIGQHIVRQLLANGREVRVADLAARSTLAIYPEDFDQVETLTGNFQDDEFIRSALTDVKCVYHLVSTTTPATSSKNMEFDLQTNLLGTLRLLQACVESGVEKVIFASSGGTVYGVLSEVPVPETHPTDPISSHGIVKLAIEKYLHLFYRLHGLQYAILRIANPYGPGQNPSAGLGAIGVFLWRLARKESIHIWGDGSVVRDYAYIEDIARAAVMVDESSLPAEIFNVGSMEGVSLNELVDVIFRTTGKTTKVIHQAARDFDVPRSILDVSKITEKIGWTAQTGLEEGIGKTWEWMQQLKQNGEDNGNSR